MSELEKGLKEQLESVIKQNQMLLEKHYQQDGKIVKLIGENSYYKSQLQQKENIIKEVRELVQRYNILIGYYDGYECYDETYDTYSHDTVKEDLLEILDKVEEI